MKRQLIEDVIKQIKLDLEFESNDTSALEMLLNNISEEDLKSYLPEGYIDNRYLDDNEDLFENE